MNRGLILICVLVMAAASQMACAEEMENSWSWAYYAVQPEDELAELCRIYAVSVPVIRQLNLLEEELIPGQILAFPVAMNQGMEYGALFLSPNRTRPYYTAAHFGISCGDMLRINYFPVEERVLKGQILMIPARHAVAAYPDSSLILRDTYVAGESDDIASVVSLFRLEMDAFMALNRLNKDDKLYSGRILHLGRIDKGQTPVRAYQVQKGDTLSRIAGRFSVAMDALVAANDLPDKHHLVQGQILLIP